MKDGMIVAIEKDELGNIIRGTNCGIEFTAIYNGKRLAYQEYSDGLKFWFGYDKYGNKIYEKNSNGFETFRVVVAKKSYGKLVKRVAYYCYVYDGRVFSEWGERWAMAKYGSETETPLYKSEILLETFYRS